MIFIVDELDAYIMHDFGWSWGQEEGTVLVLCLNLGTEKSVDRCVSDTRFGGEWKSKDTGWSGADGCEGMRMAAVWMEVGW